MHSLNKLALAGLLVFSVSLTSCKETPTSPPNNNSTPVKATVGSTFNFTDTDYSTDTTVFHAVEAVISTNASYAGKTGVLLIQATYDDGRPMDTTYAKYESTGDFSVYQADADLGIANWVTYPVATHTTQTVTYAGLGSVAISYLGKGSSTVSGTTLATENLKMAGTITYPVIGEIAIAGTMNFAPSIGYIVTGTTSGSVAGQSLGSSTHVLTSYSLK